MGRIPGSHSKTNYVKKARQPPQVWSPDWLDHMNRNFKSVRTLHERLGVLENDLSGGEPESLSWLQRRLANHCVWADAALEKIELQFARGDPVDLSQWSGILGTFTRLSRTLGLHRKPRDVTSLSDILAEGSS
jgi:hypothetical protein